MYVVYVDQRVLHVRGLLFEVSLNAVLRVCHSVVWDDVVRNFSMLRRISTETQCSRH